MAFKKSQPDEEVYITESAAEAPQRQPRVSLPLTQTEAMAFAQLVSDVTGKTAGAQQDVKGKWAVALETEVVVVKRLSTINAITKFIAKARTQELPLDDEEEEDIEE